MNVLVNSSKSSVNNQIIPLTTNALRINSLNNIQRRFLRINKTKSAN